MESGSGYLRLCPGQTVGLRYTGLVLELEDVVKKGGIVTEIKVNLGGQELEEAEVGSTSRHSSTWQSEVIPVPSVYENFISGSVTALNPPCLQFAPNTKDYSSSSPKPFAKLQVSSWSCSSAISGVSVAQMTILKQITSVQDSEY